MSNYNGKNFLDKLVVSYSRAFDHPMKLRIIYFLVKKLFKKGLKLVTPSGHNFLIKGPDFIQYQLLVKDGYELETIGCINKILSEPVTNKIYLDIGGNIGLTTFSVDSTTATVYTFEPVYKNFAHLLANYQANQSPSNINILNVGLSDREGFAEIACPSETNDAAYAIDFSGNNRKTFDKHILYLATLDRFVEQYDIKEIHLIKMDVEGFEMHIMNGFSKIMEIPTHNIIMELTDLVERRGYTKQQVISFFTDKGYSYTDIKGSQIKDFEALLEENIWFKKNL
jgi:FkbM family methyltransferase